jgi:glutathione S-transferase
MILYDSQVSGNCYKVRLLASGLGIPMYRAGEVPPPHANPSAIAERNASTIGTDSLVCAHVGLPLERRELSVIDRSNRKDVIGTLNPALRVPTLVLDDGRPLAESNAIVNYLAEGTTYMPEDRYDRAKVQQWQFFEQYEIEPNLAVARFWGIAGIDPGDEPRRSKRAGGTKALDALERGLGESGWLVADRYTVADICLYAYTHVAAEGGFTLEPYPAIRAWMARVAAQPGHIPITD